jgi:GDP/UDP-N,N'-diacetylbacillosamine 2-epimerase (hydrolysing)
MRRRICVVTGSRAEYGLLRWPMEAIRASADLQLQLIVTGAHLSPQFGLTYREIEADGFDIDWRAEILDGSDSAASVARSMGRALMSCGDALQQLRPDVLLVLGDRYECFAAVAAALVARVPVAHLHGGEVTSGAFDEALRHSITKMSHLHFVAAEEYRRRVIQLGEQPERVFLVGGLGVDAATRAKLLDRPALEAALGFDLGARNLLITFHPVTLSPVSSLEQVQELLAALDEFPDIVQIFTLPNADPQGLELSRRIEQHVAARHNTHLIASLGPLRYLSCLQFVDGVVGNSSSGLTEAPSFRTGTLNIGERQSGRLRASSVIDCSPRRDEIAAGIRRMLSPEFRLRLAEARNPYGDGGATERIVDVLRTYPLHGLVQKTFHDL